MSGSLEEVGTFRYYLKNKCYTFKIALMGRHTSCVVPQASNIKLSLKCLPVREKHQKLSTQTEPEILGLTKKLSETIFQ